MITFVILIDGLILVAAIAAHIIVRLYMRPKAGSDFDDYYYEFEDQHPGYARYQKWSHYTFTIAIVSALIFFFMTFVL